MGLRVPKVNVKGWGQRFKAEGFDGLRESPRSGANRKLDAARETEFKAALMGLQDQRLGGRVKRHYIRALLEEQFQVACCLNSVFNLLARLDLVWITVRSKHPKQSQASQDTFTHRAQVKKLPCRGDGRGA